MRVSIKIRAGLCGEPLRQEQIPADIQRPGLQRERAAAGHVDVGGPERHVLAAHPSVGDVDARAEAIEAVARGS